MNIQYASINSGSNGNCYYVGNETEGILVDVGISAKEVFKRMQQIGISLDKLKAIFISHEHSDHIKGLDVFCKKHPIPVFISELTYNNCNVLRNYPNIHFIKHGAQVNIGALQVYCFNKIHDAIDPFSFTVTLGTKKIGVFTDIGNVCANLMEQFCLCNVAFLESNYDEEMLQNSAYPYYLKQRISGGKGHLSNHMALELFKNAKTLHLKHLLLSHLSKNNNCPEKALMNFNSFAGSVNVEVASRDSASVLYEFVDEVFLTQQTLNSNRIGCQQTLF